ncbi:MAG: gfo/Idh/MocA family oxidoreductase [Candidatus Anoxymicrobium japonicum]|uniref:Gfo/Idh/MocA family oxidoreductase n=1 Tax=Candidatus Anoxymicrobium japonicum TaxID=2013648 RepID=A0A2N3G6D6_9ACTN|nr:MAG: gfo/Idh/MocA family oxidoreductase [Candidatus Anoxymicrobium japonicum]
MMHVGVIGVGAMGRNHARVFAQMPEVNLVALADVDTETVQQIARTYKANAYTDYHEMLAKEKLDIVSVSVPTRLHAAVALDVIAHGVHIFIEKPLAITLDECQAIIDAARQAGVRLGVGHIERFNPAILELRRRLENNQLGRVFQIRSRRVGPFPSRIMDVGVVFDLATHELDIMEYLIGSPIRNLYAETEQEINASHEDLLSGLLKFENGAVGVLDINWLTPTKIRELSILGERGMFHVNYLTQELYFYENNYANGWEGMVALMGVSEGRITKYELRRREPLVEELTDFVSAVTDGRESLVTGEEGMRAVYLADKLVTSGLNHQILPVNGH